ncbi:hypothetical protein [Desulfonema magnum]|uniref:hypothetical protein n=1 Tax=Desulfonema magnum TaxID=45655 RepID=UPI001A9B1689|nr:hypothetical protein [Desulfonema magnum]
MARGSEVGDGSPHLTPLASRLPPPAPRLSPHHHIKIPGVCPEGRGAKGEWQGAKGEWRGAKGEWQGVRGRGWLSASDTSRLPPPASRPSPLAPSSHKDSGCLP